jgi:protein TonB
MFEQSLTGSGHRGGRSLLVSFLAQFLLLGLALILPLIYFQQLPKFDAAAVDLRAPRLTPEVPVEIVRQAVKAAASVSRPVEHSSPPAFTAPAFTAPARIPREIPLFDDVLIPGASVPGRPGGHFDTAVFDGQFTPPPPPPDPPKPKETKATPAGPQRVGGDVMAAKLIRQIRPEYPPMAKITRTQGIVRLTASIGIDGAIQNLQLMSGHPFLIKAAMDAVRQWRYSPTLLNGQPVEVVTTIEVNFTLSQ